MELDGVPKERYWEVVDRCYLCDMCYMTKCPYVPPHPVERRLPARAAAREGGQVPQGREASRPHALEHRRARQARDDSGRGEVRQRREQVRTGARGAREGAGRAQGRAGCPEYDSARFRKTRADRTPICPSTDGSRTPGKVALFATCYVNYNEPGIGHDLLAVLAHNGVPAVLVEEEVCCGMPKLELGDLESVERCKERNIPVLARYAREGYAILTAVPSCTLMFKQELPLMFPGDADVAAVAEAMFDPFEYLVLRHRDGLLKTDFRNALGRVAYHAPCHQRVQNMGGKRASSWRWCPARRSPRSSAAPGTTARGA